MQNNRGILGLALGGAIFLGTAGAALAAPAIATSNVNVRSGPGTGYDAVDVLRRGDRVDVQGCDGGWCFVEKRGLDGWVSWQYLGEVNRPSRPDVTFQFNFGTPPRFDPPGHHGNGNNHGNGPGYGNNNGPGHNGGPGNGGHHDNDDDDDHHNGRGDDDNHGGQNSNDGNHKGNIITGPSREHSNQRPCEPGAQNFPFCF